uniref:DUF5675 domain-containing protein n=1 Tax=Anisakis simplex TaxID=6269 RepID=A0A0M3KFM2_ANISI
LAYTREPSNHRIFELDPPTPSNITDLYAVLRKGGMRIPVYAERCAETRAGMNPNFVGAKISICPNTETEPGSCVKLKGRFNVVQWIRAVNWKLISHGIELRTRDDQRLIGLADNDLYTNTIHLTGCLCARFIWSDGLFRIKNHLFILGCCLLPGNVNYIVHANSHPNWMLKSIVIANEERRSIKRHCCMWLNCDDALG